MTSASSIECIHPLLPPAQLAPTASGAFYKIVCSSILQPRVDCASDLPQNHFARPLPPEHALHAHGQDGRVRMASLRKMIDSPHCHGRIPMLTLLILTLAVLLNFVVCAYFLQLGVRWMGSKRATFVRALLASLAVGAVGVAV